MDSASDGKGLLTESDLADLANVKRPRRSGWAKQGLLRIAGKGQRYGEIDAVELAAFAALVRALDFFDAKLAWLDVRAEIRTAALAERLLVLYDYQAKSAVCAGELAGLAAHLRPGHRYELIDLSDAVADIREAYRKIKRAAPAARETQAPAPAVRKLRSS
jgi:hypothetical protein